MAGGPGAIGKAMSCKAISPNHVHQTDRLVRKMMDSMQGKHNSACDWPDDGVYGNSTLRPDLLKEIRGPTRGRKLTWHIQLIPVFRKDGSVKYTEISWFTKSLYLEQKLVAELMFLIQCYWRGECRDCVESVVAAHTAIECPDPQPMRRGLRPGMRCGWKTSVSEPSPHMLCSFQPHDRRHLPEKQRGHGSVDLRGETWVCRRVTCVCVCHSLFSSDY